MRKTDVTFYDWCIENNRQDLLDRWDYNLNGYNPNEILCCFKSKVYLKCPRGLHESELFDVSDKRRKLFNCSVCNSFKQWCVDNDKINLLNRWDYNLNKYNPEDIGYSSGVKIYLKCPNELHESELYIPNKITRTDSINLVLCKKCFSVKQWCTDNKRYDILDRWDYELNNCSPDEFLYTTKIKIYLKCPEELHESELFCISDKRLKYKCSACNSFYHWCIVNNRQDILDMWDYNLNKDNPNDVNHGTNKEYYFKINDYIQLLKISSFTSFKRKNIKKFYSFYQWCIDNDLNELIDRWDCELNNCSSSEISYGSNDKYYFKCPNHLHESQLFSLCVIVRNKGLPKCAVCNSFGQWCIDNNRVDLLELWDYDKNKNSIYEVFAKNEKKYWFKCPENKHESFKINTIYFIRFPNLKLNCPSCNSIAQYLINTFGEDGLNKYWDYNKNTKSPWDILRASKQKVWIKCQERDYHGSYHRYAYDVSNGIMCPYCTPRGKNLYKNIHKFDSLGYLYPEVLEVWSDKNKRSPYEYTKSSGKRVWWRCKDNKHNDYIRSIDSSVKVGFRCPECARERDESYLQEKVRLYLESLNYNILHENKCTITPINPKTNHNLPFDNEIVELKLIIETHGIQHYKTSVYNSVWRDLSLTPEEQLHKRKLYDRYKRFIAHHRGYFYLEIPYWADDKKETWKRLINKKIQEIKKGIK